MKYYIYSALVNWITFITLGVFVYFKDPKRLANRVYFLFSLSVTEWGFSYWLWLILSKDHASGLFWAKALNVGPTLIPVFYFHYILVLFNWVEKKKKILKLSYICGIIFFISSFTPLYVKDVASKFQFPYYPVPGILHPFYLVTFIGLPAYACFLMIKFYPRANLIQKSQIKYVVLAAVVGFGGGGTNYFPFYNIPFPPVLNIGAGLFPVILAYAIIRYKLFEIETIIHYTTMWAITVLLLIIPVCAGIALTMDWFLTINPILRISILALVLLLFLAYYHRLKPKIDHLFRRREYDYSQILSMLSMSLKGILDIKKISELVSMALKEALFLQKIGIVLEDKKTHEFNSLIKEGFVNYIPPVSASDAVVQYLNEHLHLETDLVEMDPRLSFLKESLLYQILKSEEIPLVISLTLEGDFIGLIILGKKQNLRHYTLKDIQILENIATEISLYFYNALHHFDILEKHRLDQEITLAKNIQENLLPQKLPSISGLSLYGLYAPSKEIGGDYYDFIIQQTGLPESDDRVYITIGDVSGKGLDAGLVVSSVKSALVSLTRYNDSPRDILNILNQDLYNYLGQQKFISLLLFHYISRENKILYSSAGHERILIHRKETDEIEVLKSGGVVLGMLSNIGQYLEEHSLTLDKGDKILLYTDGVTEAYSPEEEIFGINRLIESFRKHARLPIKKALHNIHGDIKEFISTRDQYDDITLVGIEKE